MLTGFVSAWIIPSGVFDHLKSTTINQHRSADRSGRSGFFPSKQEVRFLHLIGVSRFGLIAPSSSDRRLLAEGAGFRLLGSNHRAVSRPAPLRTVCVFVVFCWFWEIRRSLRRFWLAESGGLRLQGRRTVGVVWGRLRGRRIRQDVSGNHWKDEKINHESSGLTCRGENATEVIPRIHFPVSEVTFLPHRQHETRIYRVYLRRHIYTASVRKRSSAWRTIFI